MEQEMNMTRKPELYNGLQRLRRSCEENSLLRVVSRIRPIVFFGGLKFRVVKL